MSEDVASSTERLVLCLLTTWSFVFFGYAVCYMLNATLTAPALKVAVAIAKLGWLAFIVATAIYVQANTPTEVTKVLLVTVMISSGLVLFWAAPLG
jgi:hypothetical protein